MRIVVNRFLVPKGYRGITLYPFIILAKKEYLGNERLINHELIHIEQQKELLVIPFYLWYGIEFLIKRSYRGLSFEREAYSNDKNLEYLETRKRYSWFKYI